jgi:hypothetical protein
MALGIIGFLGLAVCIAWLIISAIQKKRKRNSLIGMAICIVLFVVGLSIPSEPDSTPARSSSKADKVSKNASASNNEASSTDDSAYAEALEQAQEELDSEQSSESDGKITKEAYDKIKTGMSYDEVKSIVGSEGQIIFESGDKGTDGYQISYMWRGESGGEATIGFSGKDKLTVLLKSQSGLE